MRCVVGDECLHLRLIALLHVGSGQEATLSECHKIESVDEVFIRVEQRAYAIHLIMKRAKGVVAVFATH